MLGDRVVKVEPPEGDSTRFRGPFIGNRPDPDTAIFTTRYPSTSDLSAVILVYRIFRLQL